VAEALRAAVDRTLSVAGRQARAGSALPRERATELLDEVAKRGREARDELARRGQEASEELGQRLESLERRLVALEDAIRTRSNPKPKD
jgi:polyhydroxyalkanoate synthesis regulator phasin